ncbi:type II secretion system minor pseudopilin GspK [Halorhodospira halophila]|uniref:Type II secretion system protein K n=1 Tax=Halorhodospira halophila (strain DSM 244 / SL1) TaxID=349124 RepID=A1WZP0_HALHL|nr:type II secretion system minor pseudopilin GspK [Halorhodospira halophila]ABM63152.1 general secretion pathway protein K [Halorhodospira halophila SL1]MBK1729331.1 hypothetical protein [Halorhodospira halophila]
MRAYGDIPGPQTPPWTQRGVALITALLVVALASVAAVSLTASHQIDLRRAQTSHAASQAQLHAMSVEALAAEAVQEAQIDTDQAAQMLDEDCRTPPFTTEVGGAVVEVRLEDLHCRINLNNLIDEEDEETEVGFIELVEALNRDHGDFRLDPDEVIRALRDWADPEVEDDWYSRQAPPYRPSNRPLAVPSELLQIRGVDADSYRILEPYVAALPEVGTRFNALAAPERLREAYNLPDPEDMDPGDEGLGDYVQVALRLEVDGRLHHQCSVVHAPSGEVVVRRLRPC